ncbi:MAG: hypothetical protein AB8F94_08465 [Saprospiraceae bacterium]
MKDPKDLHSLIKSLSKSEKRQFKMCVNSVHKNENNYTILFDAIDAQQEYNEIKLLRKLKKHSFSKQISRTKYLLYEQILKVLRQLYSSRSEHAKLGAMLNSAEVLFYKTFYHQALEVLKRAKKIAIANELYGLQQEIMEREKLLLPCLENYKTIKPAISKFLNSYEQIAHLVKTENEYKALHTKVRLYYDTLLNFYETSQVDAVFSKVMQHQLMLDKSNATTFLSQVLFHEIHFLNANARSNFTQANYFGDEMFSLWESKPAMKSVFRDTFIRQLRDYTFCKISSDHSQKNIPQLLNEWKSIQPFSKEEEGILSLEIDTIHFLLQLVDQSYSGIEAICNLIKEDHLVSLKKIPASQQIVIFYHIAVYHFMQKDYAKVIRQIKQIERIAGGKLRPHILKYVKLMELIVRYELEDEEIEDKDILRITRHLKSFGEMGRIEEMLLSSIKKLINLPSLDEPPTILKELKELLEIDSHPTNNKLETINNQIIKVWVKEKLSKEY